MKINNFSVLYVLPCFLLFSLFMFWAFCNLSCVDFNVSRAGWVEFSWGILMFFVHMISLFFIIKGLRAGNYDRSIFLAVLIFFIAGNSAFVNVESGALGGVSGRYYPGFKCLYEPMTCFGV